MIKISELQNGFLVASMPLGPIHTNSHIIYRKYPVGTYEGKALIVDAPFNSLTAIGDFLSTERLEAQCLLLTHGHWDHMGGASLLRQKQNLKVWASTEDSLFFENPQIMSAFAGNLELRPVTVDVPLDLKFPGARKQQSLRWDSWPELEAEAFAMPGHTPGGIAFHFPQAGCVMTGDQLFQGSVGRSDFPGGDFSLLSASIQDSLYSLAPETVVFSGHGEPTTIGREMQHNPFVSAL
ncbi:MBL fold metallo-hydrolase [Candidatus Haliotispira prima]|uniref:MBL fold metallo-hydrolase n=1 Tax=Candidatus Haliotispira prima TaxID=3034016 RepID=A0ABY8MJS9_9SPIO|nr:MBL fold metallo-hydrolase [Candidatus Haliotispira prima]